MSDPPCAPGCVVIARLVADLAKATGRTEPTVRLSYGLSGPPPTAPLRSVADRMPTSDRPCRCVTACLHDVEHGGG